MSYLFRQITILHFPHYYIVEQMPKTKRAFNKKQIVKFSLSPIINSKGQHDVVYHPMECHRRSVVSQTKREKITKELTDGAYEEIQINGRLVDGHQLPAYVLEQIRGRKDLVINQRLEQELNQKQGPNAQEEELYSEENNEWEQDDWPSEDQRQQINEEQEWEDIEEDSEEIEDQKIGDKLIDQKGKQEQQAEKRAGCIEEKLMNSCGPEKSQSKNIQSEEAGQYKLNKKQLQLLECLLPKDYQNYEVEGVQFRKFDQQGIALDQIDQYRKYFLQEGQEIAIADSFQYTPQSHPDIYDTDLKSDELKGEMKEVDEALNYELEDDAYTQIEDDFFIKMIQNQHQALQQQTCKQTQNSKKRDFKKIKAEQTESKKMEKKPIKVSKKYTGLKQSHVQSVDDKTLDAMLDRALEQFQQGKENQGTNLDHQDMQVEQEETSENLLTAYQELEAKEQYFDQNGEMDWRLLTKQQKKDYMKTKIIHTSYHQIRKKQIQQKMKGKQNINASDLHLKQLVEHISFEDDHVMKAALAKKEQSEQEEKSDSDDGLQEDIVEFHQRTSIISSGLNTVSEPAKAQKKQVEKKIDDSRFQQLSEAAHCKIVPDKRDKNETAEERKARKQKLKDQKKVKRQAKRQFKQEFQKEKKLFQKVNNPDPLARVSYITIK